MSDDPRPAPRGAQEPQFDVADRAESKNHRLVALLRELDALLTPSREDAPPLERP